MKRSGARDPKGRPDRGQEATNGLAERNGIFERRTRAPFAEVTSLGWIMISSLCLSMISALTRSVCREGKPASIFPDHALTGLGDLARLAKPGFLGEPFVIGSAD